ncbi:hypothetical protein [Plantactinospora sp. KBS50]|uniref:hypothetical protein n=1 Tax=Plantactinospora sp. KBS50 TaxID=2024580 RepID=UPI000BAB0646|nr:hypothetical protein [Plantactinospora sp. KBS50]ASW53195.1 hypothetical protein CIK06_01885 [Plantactinospora sp. KBS50]
MDAGRRHEVEQKVYAGQRLDRTDGIDLYGCADLVWLGRLAHHRRADPERTGFRLDPRFAAGGIAEFGPLAGRSYGRDLDPGAWVDELLRLRDRQDASGGCVTFVPVRAGSGEEERPAPVSALRLLAVSRLVLDNVPHLGVLLPAEGPSLAQLALNFGVDELLAGPDASTDGDAHAEPGAGADAGAGAGAELRDDLVTLIGEAGFRPVELDGEHRVVREYDAPPTLAQRRSEPQRVWS